MVKQPLSFQPPTPPSLPPSSLSLPCLSTSLFVALTFFNSKPAMIRDIILDDLAATHRETAALPREFLDRVLSGECNLPTQLDLHLFVDLLGMDDSPELQCGAASALIEFARSTSENVYAIIRGGAVPFFMRLLASKVDAVRCQAVLALSTIACGCDSLERLEHISVCWPFLNTSLWPNREPRKIRDVLLDDLAGADRETATMPREFLDGVLSGECNLPTQEDLCKFVELLGMDDYPELQCGAASALIKFAHSTSENVSAVIRGGAVPIFMRLLASDTDAVRCQAVMALKAMTCDSLERLELVLQSGALTPSYNDLACPVNLAVFEDIGVGLSSFFEGSLDWTKAALPALKNVIVNSRDDEVRANAFWALLYHTVTDDKVQVVIDEGFCPILVEHLTRGPSSVSYAAVAVVGMIAEGDLVFIQALLEHGALPGIKELLTRTNDMYVKREACLALSNITGGTKEHIGAVAEAGLISTLVDVISRSKGLYVRKFAVRAIAHTTNGSPENISRLVSEGGIQPLCEHLYWAGPGNLLICLDALEKILEAGELGKAMSCSAVNKFADEIRRCGGVEMLRYVKKKPTDPKYAPEYAPGYDPDYDPDYDVNGKAAKLLEKFWGE